ncbi:hypothetical protein KCP74_03640 [Salmonella enterica subsp. enterica]|nr:hypothetical protein KCP74_03640 [Salmonella enterica subsp. enterica]
MSWAFSWIAWPAPTVLPAARIGSSEQIEFACCLRYRTAAGTTQPPGRTYTCGLPSRGVALPLGVSTLRFDDLIASAPAKCPSRQQLPVHYYHHGGTADSVEKPASRPAAGQRKPCSRWWPGTPLAGRRPTALAEVTGVERHTGRLSSRRRRVVKP